MKRAYTNISNLEPLTKVNKNNTMYNESSQNSDNVHIQLFNLINTLNNSNANIKENQKVLNLLQNPKVVTEPLDDLGTTLIHYAALSSDKLLLELLIEHNGQSVTTQNSLGDLPIHCTTNYELVKILLDAKSLVNAVNTAGYTPLVKAVLDLEYDTIELLLERGADPTIAEPALHIPLKSLLDEELYIKFFECCEQQWRSEHNVVSDSSNYPQLLGNDSDIVKVE